MRDLLVPVFPAKHITAALKHFEGIINDSGRSDWEDGIAKVGLTVHNRKSISLRLQVSFAVARVGSQ
jgi:hypothetical protein